MALLLFYRSIGEEAGMNEVYAPCTIVWTAGGGPDGQGGDHEAFRLHGTRLASSMEECK